MIADRIVFCNGKLMILDRDGETMLEADNLGVAEFKDSRIPGTLFTHSRREVAVTFVSTHGESDLAKLALDALEAAEHELTMLHGLLAADSVAPTETRSIDTTDVLHKIEVALGKVAPKEAETASPKRSPMKDARRIGLSIAAIKSCVEMYGMEALNKLVDGVATEIKNEGKRYVKEDDREV